jgi:hypothetical protein
LALTEQIFEPFTGTSTGLPLWTNHANEWCKQILQAKVDQSQNKHFPLVPSHKNDIYFCKTALKMAKNAITNWQVVVAPSMHQIRTLVLGGAKSIQKDRSSDGSSQRMNNLNLPMHRSNAMAQSLIVVASRAWNQLPHAVKSLETLERFISAVRERLSGLP